MRQKLSLFSRIFLMGIALGAGPLFICQYSLAQPSKSDGIEEPTGLRPIVKLLQGQSSNCSGKFSLEIYADGTLVFEGIRNVAALGRQMIRVPKKEIDSLIARIEEADFMNLRDNYIRPGIADVDSEEITYNKNEKTKVVRHEGRQENITNLSLSIRALVPVDNMNNWINPMPDCREYIRIR